MFKALVYTIYWMAINIFFGLLPLGAIFYGQLIQYPSDLERVVKDGIVTYFSLALMGSVLVDFSMSQLQVSRIGQSIIFMVPVFCMALVFPVLLLEYFNGTLSTGHGTLKTLTIIQNGTIFISAIYCLPIKISIFNSDLKRRI